MSAVLATAVRKAAFISVERLGCQKPHYILNMAGSGDNIIDAGNAYEDINFLRAIQKLF